MSIGGPYDPREECADRSDDCFLYDRHALCDGTVQHRPLAVFTQDGEEYDLTTPDHRCFCWCHVIQRERQAKKALDETT